MEYLPASVERKTGSLTDIPYADGTFDVSYTCEALEHAVHLQNAVGELVRVTKPGGKIVVIDKPVEKLGILKLSPSEQWVDDRDMKKFAERFLCELEVCKSISYEDKDDGLFRGWIFTRCK